MKCLYVFLALFSFNYFAYAQFPQFQLVLLDPNVGSEVYVGCQGCSYESNDNGLNTIFQNHNVGYYQRAYVYSGAFVDSGKAVYVGSCDSCDMNQLVSDLNDYDTVIQIASSTNTDGWFNHGLALNLTNATVGVATGESNGVVTTNDASLNQLFQDYNVSYYQLVDTGTSYERYELFCNCDATLLKQELDVLTSVVSSTELLFMGLLLSIDEALKTQISIYPNPFKTKVSIDINKPISTIEVYDILGKSIYKSSSIPHFEDFSSTLTTGVYLLKLETNDGEFLTKKLMKS